MERTGYDMNQFETKKLIMKLIHQLNKLVSQCIDDTQQGLDIPTALIFIHKGTKEVCAKILQLTDDDPQDFPWIDDVACNVTTYMKELYAFIEERECLEGNGERRMSSSTTQVADSLKSVNDI